LTVETGPKSNACRDIRASIEHLLRREAGEPSLAQQGSPARAVLAM
jgi:hypothetical protein